MKKIVAHLWLQSWLENAIIYVKDLQMKSKLKMEHLLYSKKLENWMKPYLKNK